MKRSNVAKRIRYNADRVRQTTISVIDSLVGDNRELVKQRIEEWRECEKNLEFALKDWENAGDKEDSFEDLEWRQETHESLRQFMKEFEKKVDSMFPEQGLNRKVTIRRDPQKLLELGSETKALLLQITEELKTHGSNINNQTVAEQGFYWEYIPEVRTLKARWPKLFKLTLKLSSTGIIIKIRVIGDIETNWPSKFDVFREVERQSRKALYEFTNSSELPSYDSITARLLSWFHIRRDLFHQKCSFTQRYVAFGAVGENGQLEARPPMIRDESHKASFQTDLF